MYNFLLGLHSLLRWLILLLLVLNIIRLFSAKGPQKTGSSLLLLIFAHTTLLIGLYQYFFGGFGVSLFQQGPQVMKDSALRFWAVEHITGMIVAIALITIGHLKLKKTGKARPTAILYLIALILILAVIPWPFREGIGRPWFHGF
jgi:hypothetical protein